MNRSKSEEDKEAKHYLSKYLENPAAMSCYERVVAAFREAMADARRSP